MSLLTGIKNDEYQSVGGFTSCRHARGLKILNRLKGASDRRSLAESGNRVKSNFQNSPPSVALGFPDCDRYSGVPESGGTHGIAETPGSMYRTVVRHADGTLVLLEELVECLR